ncbi:Imm1 family immunity protein [Actinomadura sp. NBRC 104412]|uniref:Imm1 family immunity protein n=1 Tax=Actinomadura sp. NBRC 104412 TaxID=3032203 RepID=UPI00333069F5
MENLRHEIIDPTYDPGEEACFSFSERRLSHSNAVAGSYLRFAVNVTTGYGGLIWNLDQIVPGKPEDRIWISDNPEPPDFDPRVVSDPGYPLFHDPRSTVPLAHVRSALEEFCHVGTGDRPNCIRWVRGELNGQRYDGKPESDAFHSPYDPWA